MEAVWAGDSHWRADEEGEVEKTTRAADWAERERDSGWPRTGSGVGSEGKEKGMGALV